MPLQQLVEYFNDRLEREHKSHLRPFILQDGKAYGIFGPLRVGSFMRPLRISSSHAQIAGYVAHSVVATHQTGLPTHRAQADPAASAETTESIVNFDRLTRTVHMLNYLPQSHLDDLLILDVDPRHILSVKTDHGAYFEEIIIKCGLKTHNVAIGLKINQEYSRVYPSLLKGLSNYQGHGYRVALKFDYQTLDKSTFELISRAAPDFVALSAQHLDSVRDPKMEEKLSQLSQWVTSIHGQTLLLDVDDRQQASLAEKMHFDLVQGGYFETEEDVSTEQS